MDGSDLGFREHYSLKGFCCLPIAVGTIVKVFYTRSIPCRWWSRALETSQMDETRVQALFFVRRRPPPGLEVAGPSAPLAALLPIPVRVGAVADWPFITRPPPVLPLLLSVSILRLTLLLLLPVLPLRLSKKTLNLVLLLLLLPPFLPPLPSW